ncbi:hypothetical protein LEMLEM_LOCUS13775, partial [Lemmus lemmus]
MWYYALNLKGAPPPVCFVVCLFALMLLLPSWWSCLGVCQKFAKWSKKEITGFEPSGKYYPWPLSVNSLLPIHGDMNSCPLQTHMHTNTHTHTYTRIHM